MSAAGLIVSGARERSRATLQARIRRAASGFAALGIGPRDCVALLLRNDFPFLEASLAAAMLGGYAVPINWHWKPEEVGYLLRDCEARVVVAHDDLLPLLAEAPPGVTVLQVATPPELAAAYGIAPAAASSGGVATCSTVTPGGASASSGSRSSCATTTRASQSRNR